MSWKQRLKRVFHIDVEHCGVCGGTLRVIACIETPEVIERILTHLAARETGGANHPRAPPLRAQPAGRTARTCPPVGGSPARGLRGLSGSREGHVPRPAGVRAPGREPPAASQGRNGVSRAVVQRAGRVEGERYQPPVSVS